MRKWRLVRYLCRQPSSTDYSDRNEIFVQNTQHVTHCGRLLTEVLGRFYAPVGSIITVHLHTPIESSNHQHQIKQVIEQKIFNGFQLALVHYLIRILTGSC